MKITIKLFYITFLLLTILSCGHKENVFDKSKWSQKIDGFYQYREEMVEDLMSNHLRKGMSYKELQNLLGEPENYTDLEENTIAYGIMEDYGWNIDPVETKTLRIELTKDSLVSGYKIIHWKN
ncbi:MAG: hypothetical protein CUR32_01285 [Flavobacterium sp.]|nr:MAG: hypothetical protein CUR32_01285 [Flavobacterium sp.] [Flavobacterium sp. FEMGT703F]